MNRAGNWIFTKMFKRIRFCKVYLLPQLTVAPLCLRKFCTPFKNMEGKVERNLSSSSWVVDILKIIRQLNPLLIDLKTTKIEMKIDQRNDEIFLNYFSHFCIELFFFFKSCFSILGYTEYLQVYTKFVCVFYWRQNQELFI